MKNLTSRDAELISLLQVNARESISNLARKLGLSRTAVQERLNKLQRMGVIQGFTVKLNPDWEREQINTFVSLVTDPKHSARIVQKLGQMPAIKALWTVSGSSDLIAFASAGTTEDINDVLDEIWKIEGVTRTESSIILSTKFDHR